MSYGTYTGLTKLILILRILYWYYRTYYCISDIEVPVGTTEHFNGTKVPVGTTEQIPYTEVLIGTTGLILILRILYWYYRTYYCISDIEVPVGTTELVLIY